MSQQVSYFAGDPIEQGQDLDAAGSVDTKEAAPRKKGTAFLTKQVGTTEGSSGGMSAAADVGAVILAAGYSSRMKAFKPLLPVGEKSALERLVSTLTDAGIRRIVVVTGHEREKLQPVMAAMNETYGAGKDDASGCIMEAYNTDYSSGMFSSVKTGLSAGKEVFGNPKGWFLLPVDCPLISSSMIWRLMEYIEEEEDGGQDDGVLSGGGTRFYVPVFEGKKGHPLYIPRGYIAEICGHDGTGGLKAITDRYTDRMVRVPVDEEGCVMDMDTPAGYEEIKAFLAAGCRRAPLAELAAGRRIFLVRHGETQQHAEKMFIGRYDVPLREGAEEAVMQMAQRLAGQAPDVNVIYTSPLQRAHQTSRILRDVLPGDLRLCIIEAFQEIHLGEWDGRPIRWVRENYTQEYRRRGEDLFAFKTGNRAENFYDVQYRAVKALRNILENDASKDIIIVTHNTVIRALENNLKGYRVDDEWKKIEKNDYVVVEP